MSEKRKTIRSTTKQIKTLVDYMSTNKDFANGEYTGPLGAKKLEAQWRELKLLLQEQGPEKSVEQWKITWRDLKKKARDEGSKVRRARNVTGNNMPIPELSENSSKILDVIGTECAVGLDTEESGIGGDDFLILPPPVEFNPIVSPMPLCSTPPALRPTLPTSSTSTSHIGLQPLVPPTPHMPPTPLSGIPDSSSNSHTTTPASATSRNRGRLPGEFISLQQENNDLTKKLCGLLGESNNLKREQNCILRERNYLIRRNRFGRHSRRGAGAGGLLD